MKHLFFLILALLSFSCSKKEELAPTLAGTNWHWTSKGQGQTQRISFVDSDSYYMKFATGGFTDDIIEGGYDYKHPDVFMFDTPFISQGQLVRNGDTLKQRNTDVYFLRDK